MPSWIRTFWRRSFLKVRELYQKEGGKFPDPILNLDLELHGSGESVAVGSRQGNQRQGAGRRHRSGHASSTIKPASNCRASHGCATTASTICGNWLCCGSWTEAGPHDAAPRHRGSVRARHLSELGVVVAGEPPRAVQPRFVRSERQALGSRSPHRSGGTSRRRWVGNDVPDFKPTPSPRTTWARSS